MIIFVLNCGSSSIKYQIIDMPNETVRISGGVSRIGHNNARFTFEASQKKQTQQRIDNHEQGIDLILNSIEAESGSTGIGLKNIDAAGHRPTRV